MCKCGCQAVSRGAEAASGDGAERRHHLSRASSSPDAADERHSNDSNDEGTWKVSFPGKEDVRVEGARVTGARLNKALELVTAADDVSSNPSPARARALSLPLAPGR
eukprot:65420-Rhodomonas_salina.1